MSGAPARTPVVDSHVHFWDPGSLQYPWLEGLSALQHTFLPVNYSAATEGMSIEKAVFVECNPRPDQGVEEVRFVERLAEAEPRIAGIVAFADLTDAQFQTQLERLADLPLVKGIRHNIQGNALGFCLQPAFVEGVREVGRRGLSFDLCATHDQLADVVELVRRCPHTRLVLDHCGKPAIRESLWEPWATSIAELAAFGNIWCKLSGLLTEADLAGPREEDLLPYARHAVEQFGTERVMYGSDWPVLTLAGQYADWYQFTCRLTKSWTAAEAQRFYRDNAMQFYQL